ncbi:MAG: nitroreductase/quinone reductase family protein [Chloroflexota bacterium]|nr:nitroreductase/quinone reductase family protein [Chloroflexota bacterium]
MSRIDSPALRGTLLGRLLMVINPVMKRLLRSPLHWPWSRRFAVVEWTGRRSGRRYSTPVGYFKQGDEAWVTTGDAWWKNLESNPEVRLWLAGGEVAGSATPVTDPAESAELHAALFSARPLFARLAGLSARPARSQIAAAIKAGRMFVRITLQP